MPLTTAERAKAYRERKWLRALDQPSTSAAAFAPNPDDETPAATPVECSRSESYVEMVDLPEVSDVQSRQDFETRWSHSNRYLDDAFLKNDFGHACDVCYRLWLRKDFLFQMPSAYSEATRLIFPNMNPDTETPILMCGDFNTDVIQNILFVNFMKSKFNLDCIISASTTLGNTCIDLTFTRNMSVQTVLYGSYFSYHRPLLNRLMLTHCGRVTQICVFNTVNVGTSASSP